MRKFIIPLFVVAFLFSCGEDDILNDSTDDTTDDEIVDETSDDEDVIVAYESESFDDLTIADFDHIDTPYEVELSALSAGRILKDSDDLATMISDLLDGALISVEEDESRGLSVYVVKIIFDDGSVVNVTVVQDIFEILSIEAIPSNDLQSEVSIDGFISLETAIQTANELIDGDIVRWEISLEEDNVLEFEIHIESTDGTRYEIELDAASGELIAQKIFENEEDVAEFEEEAEEENPEISSDILAAVANFIDESVIYAQTVDNEGDGIDDWNVLVETSSGAIVALVIDSSTKELKEATGDAGPFDYEMSFLTDGVSFSEQLATVEGQMSIDVDRWNYGYQVTAGFEYWGLNFYAEDDNGNLTTVSIHAASGEWVESNTTPSEALLTQLESYISGDLESAYLYQNDGVPFWDIKFYTTTGIELNIFIYDDTYEIMRAYDNDNDSEDLSYDFNFGDGAVVDLPEGITIAEDFLGDFDAVSYDWIYYDSQEVDEVEYKTLIISLYDPNQTYYAVWIDVETGSVIKEEIF
ncbi:Peptidase propeptide and YPEB domain-containing protein [Reichenbachiella faecimaris]|uniref:Peptidase propeptide and YPEB domain-containing protein n=1 Tax=Reichenbachiella faecimaris TaxID=692418 RepID=A0A1W2G8W6_REIFA|nr:PepSY domain-containing protein [Reichenbachiella faecimaris]SMD32736.1 Peptidase propeptide and YPEB domain-containing protein [Reichenbachiella faecimaris]